VILGVPTNVDFLGDIMRNAVFRSGKLHTGFIAEQASALAAATLSGGDEAEVVLAALLGDAGFRLTAFGVPEPYASIGDWHN
jgi:pyruvate carboxylase